MMMSSQSSTTTNEEDNNTTIDDVVCREEDNNNATNKNNNSIDIEPPRNVNVAASLATTERGRDNNDLNVSRRVVSSNVPELNPCAHVFVPPVKLKIQDTSLDNSSQVLDRGKKTKLVVRSSIFCHVFFIM
jgi:hypothetical protein